jgi:hypothetical protein
MLFPIMIFLMVLSPLFIPVAVTVVHGVRGWNSERTNYPVHAYRAMVAAVPAAAQ